MFGNIVWLSLTNIKRNKFRTILFFLIAFFISHALFLINISKTFLKFPEFTDVKQFFYIIIFSVLLISVFILASVSILFIKLRREELGILRIFGARKADILFLSSLEIFFVSCTGALTGILSIILMILSRVLYLPYFLEGMKSLKLIKLIGIAGQTTFSVIIIELFITLILISTLLKNDITDMSRGSI